jgi:hypothetical protein
MVEIAKHLIRGVSTVLEIWPKPRRFEPKRYRPPATEAEALRMDAEKIGRDFRTVIDRTTDEPKQSAATR